jgi:hypothetical protein
MMLPLFALVACLVPRWAVDAALHRPGRGALSPTLGGLLLAACAGCGHAPSVVDAGAFGGGWVVMEWRGVLVELRTDVACRTKGECVVTACVTVEGGEPVCREVAR